VLEVLEGAQADVRLLGEILLGESGASATIAQRQSNCTELLVNRLTSTGHV
jgi:hypothetical protein